MASELSRAGARRPPYNWGFFLLLVLAVEFWIIVTTSLADKL